ncbi:MAG: hypothetical protein RBT11_10265 [Desulfobacterales bacterium]|jgi:predicted hotdog family 3-hydroxylacyl-ACP dehydratase|nr:hypothetical protein [Desulfobacterales bacterium]
MDSAGIEDLLVHRGRMLLIRQIITVNMTKAITRALVTDQWPLVNNGGANPLVLIEVAAQTAGVYNSWRLHRKQGPNADHRGWMVGIKISRFFVDRIPLGTEIITEAQNQFEYDGYREIRGVATIHGHTAADVTLQIMQAGIENS